MYQQVNFHYADLDGPPPGLVRGDMRRNDSFTGPEIFAFLLDLGLTLGTFFALPKLATHVPQLDAVGPPVVWGLGGALLVSFVNRVVLQRLFQATVGKALAGLRVVRRGDAGRPTLFELIRSWLFGAGYALAEEAHWTSDRTWRFQLGWARARDLRAYRYSVTNRTVHR